MFFCRGGVRLRGHLAFRIRVGNGYLWVFGGRVTALGCAVESATSAVMMVGKLTVATKSTFGVFTVVNGTRPVAFTAVATGGGMVRAATVSLV